MREEPRKEPAVIARADMGNRFTAKDMRASFWAGAAFEREHQFMPPEVRPAKAAEEALARWPD